VNGVAQATRHSSDWVGPWAATALDPGPPNFDRPSPVSEYGNQETYAMALMVRERTPRA
jgi:hypothetical protein